MDNGGNLVYQVKAGPSRAMMKELALIEFLEVFGWVPDAVTV